MEAGKRRLSCSAARRAFFAGQPKAADRIPHRAGAERDAMIRLELGLNLRKRYTRLRANMRRQRQLLIRR